MLEVIEEKADANTCRIEELENKKITLVQLINDLQKHIDDVQKQLQAVDDEIYDEIRRKNKELQNDITVNQTDISDLKELTRYFKIEDVVDGAVPNVLDIFALKTRIVNLTNEEDRPYAIIDDVLELLSHYISIEVLSEYVSRESLSAYALKTELPNLLPYAKTIDLIPYALITSLTSYAKKTDLTPYALITSLTSYAKKTDLTPYALITSLTSYAKKTDLTPYALITSLTSYAKKTDLTPYAKKTELPDLTPYALTSSLTLYAKKTDVSLNFARKTELTYYVKKSDLGILQEVGSDYDFGYINQGDNISGFYYSIYFHDEYGNQIDNEYVDPENNPITKICFPPPDPNRIGSDEKLYLYLGREAKQQNLLGHFYLDYDLYQCFFTQTSYAHNLVGSIEFDEVVLIDYNKQYEFLMVSSYDSANAILFYRPNSLKTKVMSAEYSENNYVKRSVYNALLARVQALEARLA